MEISIFVAFDLKMSIQAPKLRFWGDLTPFGSLSMNSQKARFRVSPRRLSH